MLAIPFIADLPHRFKSLFTIGPSDFIGLFCHASYVVTDSFHGTAFSLIFNKNFWTLSRKNESRITSILNILGLEDRILYFEDDFSMNLTQPINYDNANIMFKSYRENALKIIKDMINERMQCKK